MYFDEHGLVLKDTGSTNGFTVRGQKLREARIEPGEVVGLCEFELIFSFAPTSRVRDPAMLSMPPEPSQGRAVPSDDWDSDEDDAGGTDITVIKQVAKPAAAPALGPPPEVSQSSLMNRLMFERPPTSEEALPKAHGRDPLDDDEEIDGDEPPPLDARPLVLSLQDEANATTVAHPYGQVVVEVIHTLNREVVGVETVPPGTTTWWAGTPNLLESLWVVPTPARFPVVAHNRPGEYSVQVPHDPDWKIFHRGKRQVDLFRSGPFVGCVAEFDDQIEISAGPHSLYVHCRKLAPTLKVSGTLRHWLPSAELWAAVGVSLVMHLGLAALPLVRGSMTTMAQAQMDFFKPPRPKETKELEWSAPVAIATAKPPADAEPAAVPEKAAGAPSPSATPLPPHSKRLPLTGPKPVLAPLPEPESLELAPPRRLPLKSVSIADFKVSGMIAGLPEIQIETRTGGTMQGATATLRSGAPLPAGVVGTGGTGRMTRGKYPELALRSHIKKFIPEIRSCFEKVLEREPGIAGKIDMEWVITNVGSVTDIRATYDDVGSPALVRCIKGVIGDWVFPPPKGGATRVGYPFEFARTKR